MEVPETFLRVDFDAEFESALIVDGTAPIQSAKEHF
jgi:hypothetical protein